MPYTPTNWEDLPSVATPITAAELNRIEAGVDAAVEFADTHPGAVDPHTQYQKESEKGQAGGYASLDGSGTVPAAQIPAIAITTYLGSVANQSAMLALSGQVGDWAIRSDLGQTAIITGADPTQLADWTFLAYPAAPVVSVNSETGAVVLDATDVGAEPAGAIAAHESTYDHTDIPNPTGAAEQYVWTADGSGSASWQPGGGSAPTDSYWKFSNLTADADPGSGKFRFNDPLRSGTTFLYIDNTTLAGLNISNFATLLANGDQVFIQPKADAASRVRYTVTGPAVDGTGYWKIPVSVSVAATGSEISNNAEVLLLWNIAALGGTPSTHIHDDRYYTESEIDTLLSGKSNTGHVHDDRYYTESETDTLLSGKANTSHGSHNTTTYATTPPGSPNIGDRWISDETGNEYVWLNDGTSTQWIMTDAGGSGGGGGSLTVQYENGNIATGVTQIDFQGAGVTATAGSGEVVVTIPGASGGHTIKDEGTPLTARTGLNFVGAAVAAIDDAANNETDIIIDGSYNIPAVDNALWPLHTGAVPMSTTNGGLYCIKIKLPRSMTFNRYTAHVSVSAAGATLRFGVYNDDSTGNPSDLVSGTEVSGVDASSSGVKFAFLGAPVTLNAGQYWIAICVQGGTPTMTAFGPPLNVTQDLGITDITVSPGLHYKHNTAYTSGALPSNWGYSSTNPVAVPRVSIRRSA